MFAGSDCDWWGGFQCSGLQSDFWSDTVNSIWTRKKGSSCLILLLCQKHNAEIIKCLIFMPWMQINSVKFAPNHGYVLTGSSDKVKADAKFHIICPFLNLC